MAKDKRTKTGLLDEIEIVRCKLFGEVKAVDELRSELRRSKADQNVQKIRIGELKRSMEAIRQSIKTAVSTRYPRTVAFGTVEEVWYRGEAFHPGYDGDNEDVRLLKLIDDECREGAKE